MRNMVFVRSVEESSEDGPSMRIIQMIAVHC